MSDFVIYAKCVTTISVYHVREGSSHRIYRTPWPGDPRINIQNYKGKAKAYQVRQVLMAIDKLEADDVYTK